MREFFASRARRIVLMVGALVGAVGLAFATVAITSTIGGSVATADTAASWRVSEFTVAECSGGMAGTAWSTPKGGHVNATAETVNGQALQAQSCDLSVTLQNTGGTPLELTGVTGYPVAMPEGWALELGSAAGGQIAAGDSRTFTATIGVDEGSTPVGGNFEVTVNAKAVAPSAA